MLGGGGGESSSDESLYRLPEPRRLSRCPLFLCSPEPRRSLSSNSQALSLSRRCFFLAPAEIKGKRNQAPKAIEVKQEQFQYKYTCILRKL